MRMRRVNRYYCDHCKKAGMRKDVIAKHELHCCRNADRECRMCKLAERDQPSAEVLIGAADKGLARLREVAGHCPACILTGILLWKKREFPHGPPRYAGGPEDGYAPDPECDLYAQHDDFNFKEEAKAYLAQHEPEPALW
jgi:hypothetical protein